MNMRKHSISALVVSLVMTLLIICSITPAYALVYTDGDVWIDTAGNNMTAEEAAQWVYETNDTGISITSYTGEIVDGQIVGNMPATINGAPVTVIDNVFSGNTNIVTAPAIPDTVTSMQRAFRNCTSLVTAPRIPNSVTTAAQAFYGCTALTGDVYLGDNLSPVSVSMSTKLNINVIYSQYNKYCAEYTTFGTNLVPATVTLTLEKTNDRGEVLSDWIGADGNYMTDKEANLWAVDGTSVNYIGQIIDGEIVGQVPKVANGVTITSFGYNNGSTGKEHSMFIGNSNVKGAKAALVTAPQIPDTFIYLNYAFEECTALVNAPVIPESVINLNYTFYRCSSLEVAPEIPDSVLPQNFKYTFAETGIIVAPTLPEYESANLNYNLYYTFYNCKNLTTATLPEGVGKLNSTFRGCSALETIPEIPDGAVMMAYTFYDASVVEGDVYIPDTVTSMVKVFGGTTKTINMVYNETNTAAAEYAAESNVTKVVKSDYDDSSVPTAGETDDSVEVSVKASSDIYTLEVGETLQLEGTVSDETLMYQWVVQDIFDTDPNNPYATVDSNGVVTAVDGPGYVIAGLLVQFADGTEHGYGMVLIEITKDGTVSYVPGDYRDGSNSDGISVPYGGAASYSGGFNPSYSYQGTGYTTYDQLGGVSLVASGGSGSGGSTGSGSSGSGSGSGGGIPVVPDPGTDEESISTPSHVTSLLDGTKYTEQSEITGEIVDKFVNYLRVGKGNQFEVVNLNPSDYDNYKLVSLSLTEQPSVLVTQDGYATAVYEGASIIVLADENDKVIDWHLILVGDTNTYDGEMPDYTIEDMIYESRVNIGEENMPIYGLVESLQMIDVTLPIQMTFTIDTDRLFHAPDAEIVSNFAAPLEITIIDVNKSENAPTLVSPDKYTDTEWNNLGISQTQNNLALLVNGYDISTNGNKIGDLRSAFKEEQRMVLSLTAKYGKAWNNTEDVSFTYNLVFEFAMPE